MLKDRELLVLREAAGKASAEVVKAVIPAATTLFRVKVDSKVIDLTSVPAAEAFHGCVMEVMMSVPDIIDEVGKALAEFMAMASADDDWGGAPAGTSTYNEKERVDDRPLTEKQLAVVDRWKRKTFANKDEAEKWMRSRFGVVNERQLNATTGKPLIDSIFKGNPMKDFNGKEGYDPFDGE